MSKAILINNTDSKITDLADILLVARDLGRKVLRTRWIHVDPIVTAYKDGYLVVVSEGEDPNGKETKGRVESTNKEGVEQGKAKQK